MVVADRCTVVAGECAVVVGGRAVVTGGCTVVTGGRAVSECVCFFDSIMDKIHYQRVERQKINKQSKLITENLGFLKIHKNR